MKESKSEHCFLFTSGRHLKGGGGANIIRSQRAREMCGGSTIFVKGKVGSFATYGFR